MNANRLGKALTDRARRRLYGKPPVNQPAGDVAVAVALPRSVAEDGRSRILRTPAPHRSVASVTTRASHPGR